MKPKQIILGTAVCGLELKATVVSSLLSQSEGAVWQCSLPSLNGAEFRDPGNPKVPSEHTAMKCVAVVAVQ
jgi:hypothetical protein